MTTSLSEVDAGVAVLVSLNTHHAWIAQVRVDELPSRLHASRPFALGGVVVLAAGAPTGCRLRFTANGHEVSGRWGEASPKMAQLHPTSINGPAARFRFDGVSLGPRERAQLDLVDAAGDCVPLLELWCAPPLRAAGASLAEGRSVTKEPLDRLIFDIGACDGEDSAFYLSKGFRVVAVEANARLAESLRARFKTHIAAGRYAVENIAIAEGEGSITFYVNEDMSEWSSLHKQSKATRSQFTEVTVPTLTLGTLFQRHGVPYYAKLDIEGGELFAIRSLSLIQQASPQHISFEVNPDWPQILELLFNLGYRKFQLLRQGAQFLLPLPPRNVEGVDVDFVTFSNNMSGPFGRDLPIDRWGGIVDIVREVSAAQEDQAKRRLNGEKPGWYDVHAALPGALDPDL